MPDSYVYSDRLYARPIENEDLERIAALYLNDKKDDFDSIKDAFDVNNKIDEKKLLRVIRDRIPYYQSVKLSKRKPFSRFVVFDQETDECIGLFGFDSMNINDEMISISENSDEYDNSQDSILISYKIHTNQVNKGYCTEIARELISWFFENFTHTQLLANVYKDNIASHKVLEKLGFEKVFEFKYLGSDVPNVNCLGLLAENLNY
jgi:hypothetical protein